MGATLAVVRPPVIDPPYFVIPILLTYLILTPFVYQDFACHLHPTTRYSMYPTL